MKTITTSVGTNFTRRDDDTIIINHPDFPEMSDFQFGEVIEEDGTTGVRITLPSPYDEIELSVEVLRAIADLAEGQ